MHPEMIRAIAAEQVADRQAVAQARKRAKLARQARKARRHGGSAPDQLDGILVPDYIDGTFHGEARPAKARPSRLTPGQAPVRKVPDLRCRPRRAGGARGAPRDAA